MKRYFLLTLCLVCMFVGTALGDYFSSEALKRAEQFVSVIDQGNFDAAYDSGSRFMKLTVQRDDWLAGQSRTVELLGSPVARELMTVKSRSSYPGLPDGKYLIVSYQTRTEYKKKAVEVLLLKEQSDGWHVCKYSIR